MKFIILTLAGMALGTAVVAQNQAGQVAVNAGIGYSLIFDVVTSPSSSSSSGSVTRSYELPVLNGVLDFGTGSRFSIGIGAAYQKAGLYWDNWNNNGNNPPQSFTETISRLNIGIRPLVHFEPSDNFDIYVGLRFGWSAWSEVNGSSNPIYTPIIGSIGLPSFQALVGTRVYINKVFGFHAEFAFGTPYFGEGGLTFRFGNNHSTESNTTSTDFHHS